jgi:hypothetical protein
MIGIKTIFLLFFNELKFFVLFDKAADCTQLDYFSV